MHLEIFHICVSLRFDLVTHSHLPSSHSQVVADMEGRESKDGGRRDGGKEGGKEGMHGGFSL